MIIFGQCCVDPLTGTTATSSLQLLETVIELPAGVIVYETQDGFTFLQVSDQFAEDGTALRDSAANIRTATTPVVIALISSSSGYVDAAPMVRAHPCFLVFLS
ncbi:MAG: hypothetical protein OXQ29_02820 [Rhodospirillaceae bacterium]|nr:hypothetical protein [Rhodospirillaceae bacterium]